MVRLQKESSALTVTLPLQHFHHDPRLGLPLTKDIDEGVRQQVAELVGRVALVDGAGSRLHVAEDHRVVVHLPAAVFGRICYRGQDGKAVKQLRSRSDEGQ